MSLVVDTIFRGLALLASGRGCRHQAAAAAVSPHLPPEEHQLALYLGVVRVPLLLLSCYNPQHLEKKQGVACKRTPAVQQTLVVKNSVFWKQEVIKSGM